MKQNCSLCNKNVATKKVFDNSDNETKFSCDSCLTEDMIVMKILEDEEETEEANEQEIQLDQEPDVIHGRLHLVNKTRKEAECRVCHKIIEVGSKCFNQKKQIGKMPFPLQTKVCFECGTKLNKQGVETAEK